MQHSAKGTLLCSLGIVLPYALCFAECCGHGQSTRQTSKLCRVPLPKHSIKWRSFPSAWPSQHLVKPPSPSIGRLMVVLLPFFTEFISAFGKIFAWVPDKKHSTKSYLPSDPMSCHVCRGGLWQTLYRVRFGLMPVALGKAAEFSSARTYWTVSLSLGSGSSISFSHRTLDFWILNRSTKFYHSKKINCDKGFGDN